MKTTTRKAYWPIYGLFMLLLVYACRNQEADPPTPYVFNTLRDLQLPAAKISAPPAITAIAATTTPSPLANSLSSGVAGIPSTGVVPGNVNQAVSAINTALSGAGTTSAGLVSSFTPQVVNTLTSQGTLPGGLQGTVSTIAANAVIQPYLLTFTLPTINGQDVTPTTLSVTGPGLVSPIIIPVTIKPINYSGADACYKAANDLFDSKILNLNSDRLAQIASINATYAAEKTTAESDITGCLSANVSKYSALITTARQTLNANIGDLNAARLILGDAAYQSLTALVYVQYAYQIQTYYKLQAAEINACTLVSALRIESALFARDTDRNSSNNGFNTTVKQAQELVLKLYDSCHNQGSGG